jgi:antitoxin (DNA-binding transcriptional repressor) of toxin-antitoxin stability system
MTTISVREAQANLAALIHELAPGQVVIITENDQPVAKLVALPAEKPRPTPGRCKGMLTVVAEDEAHLDEFADYLR